MPGNELVPTGGKIVGFRYGKAAPVRDALLAEAEAVALWDSLVDSADNRLLDALAIVTSVNGLASATEDEMVASRDRALVAAATIELETAERIHELVLGGSRDTSPGRNGRELLPSLLVQRIADNLVAGTGLGRRAPTQGSRRMHAVHSRAASDSGGDSTLPATEGELREVAAALYAASGYSAKAATLARQALPEVSIIANLALAAGSVSSSVSYVSREILLYVCCREFRTAAKRAGELLQAVRSELGAGSSRRQLHAQYSASSSNVRRTTGQARFALIMSALCDQLLEVLSNDFDTIKWQQIRAKLRLLARVATDSGDSNLLTVADRLSGTVLPLESASLSSVLTRYAADLPPEWFATTVRSGSSRSIYELWPPQVEAIESGLLKQPAFVLSLPTSTGKTLLAEMRIAEVLRRSPDGLVVYVAPYQALATQVVRKLRERLQPAGIAWPLLWTGTYEIDPSITDLGQLVVMTPEKFDAVLRSDLDEDRRSADLRERLRFVILDECHLVGRPGRGLVYELLIARLKARFPAIELLAMSAVLGNADDLTTWITGQSMRSVVSDWRPTKSRSAIVDQDGRLTTVDGQQIGTMSLPRGARANIIRRAAGTVHELIRAQRSPVLVVEPRRDYAEKVALELLVLSPVDINLDTERGRERERVARIAEIELGNQASLARLLRSGYAFHHAGLSARMREQIEELSRHGHLSVVSSTTTLAEGVDLPFSSVVVPHVNFVGGLTPSLANNISGRAGRAGQNVEGLVLYLQPRSTSGKRSLEAALVNTVEDVESQLPAILTRPRSIIEYRNRWRYQSQLIGAVGEETFGADQALGLIRGTLAATSSQANRLVSQLRHDLADLELVDPPIATAASPYRLTPFGRAASLSGLSIDSVRLVLRRLRSSSSIYWTDETSWLQEPLRDALLDEIATLAMLPLEAIEIATEADHSHAGLRALTDPGPSADGARDDAVRFDSVMLREWMRGRSIDDFSADALRLPAVGPLKDSAAEVRKLAVSEYFAKLTQTASWTYSGVVRIAEYMRDVGERRVPESVRAGVQLIECGVPSQVAAGLVERLDMPRSLAAQISSNDSFDERPPSPTDRLTRLLEVMTSIDEEFIATRIGSSAAAALVDFMTGGVEGEPDDWG